MKQSRRELNKIQCRSRILKMSRRLFTAKGYENTTMEDIAEASEVSKATLYNYFSSKENLLLGIVEAALEEIRQLVAVDLCREPDSVEKIRQVLETLAVDSIRYITLTRRIFYLNVSEDNALHVTRLELLEILGQLVNEARERGQLRQDLTAEELVDAFMGVYLVTQFGWEDIGQYTEAQCRQKVRRAMDAILNGLLPAKEE